MVAEALPQHGGQLTRSIETFFRSISTIKTARIAQREALQAQFLVDNLKPQIVKEVTVRKRNSSEKHTLGVINVLSPYTQHEEHVMIANIDPDTYSPTPTEMSLAEMEATIQLSANILQGMKDPASHVISWGYNNSPLNFGTQELQGGMQSLTTKFHAHEWSRPRDSELAKSPFEKLPENVRNYLVGDKYNPIGDAVIRHILESDTSGLLQSTAIWEERQVIHVPLTLTLQELFAQPKRTALFIKDLHTKFETATQQFWDAVTTEGYEEFKEYLRTIFEEGLPADESLFTAVPMLRSLAERRELLAGLSPELFPQAVITLLRKLNASFKERSDELNPAKWIRNGLGYTFVIVQDGIDKPATLMIRPAIMIRSSVGGVVETEGLSLKRLQADDPNAAHIIDENIQNMNRLRMRLPEEIVL